VKILFLFSVVLLYACAPKYEWTTGTVVSVKVDTATNWVGTLGNCRVVIEASGGRKTLAVYWRDCYAISEGDKVQAFRMSPDSPGYDGIDKRWRIAQ
jgi:hypothetical protein